MIKQLGSQDAQSDEGEWTKLISRIQRKKCYNTVCGSTRGEKLILQEWRGQKKVLGKL